MARPKKFGIRSAPRKSPNYFLRGTRRDGSRYEFSSPIPIEPPADTPKELLDQKRAELRKHAEEASEVIKRREWGEITVEECECRFKGIAQRVTRQDCKVSTCYFIVAWVWEHVLRGKVHPNRAGKIARVMYAFLEHVGRVATQTIHELRPDHFETFIMNRRIAKYSAAVVNDEVTLLKSLASDIQKITGIDCGAELQLEESDTQEKGLFTHEEILRILAATKVMRELASEWRTFLLLLLYTQMRPEDAAILQRKDVDLGSGTIRFIAQKVQGFGRKPLRKPLHQSLWSYLEEMVSEIPLDPNDYLCPHIAFRLGNSLNSAFNRILKAAGVDPSRTTGEHRRKAWSAKSLYSLRHTGIVWLAANGANDQAQKTELGDSTSKALKHYQHPNDPVMIESERRRVNNMPDINTKWDGGANTKTQERAKRFQSSDRQINYPGTESRELAERRRHINQMPKITLNRTKHL